MQYPEIHKALDNFGKDTVTLAVKNLRERGATTRRKGLEQGLKYVVIEHTGGLECDIQAPFYGAFVDQGVKGHGRGAWKPWKPKQQQAPDSPFSFKSWGPPPDVFREWIKNKPVQPRNPLTGEFMSPGQSAFLMARSAGRFGLRPTRFMTDALEETLPALRSNLQLALHRDVQTYMNREIFKLKSDGSNRSASA